MELIRWCKKLILEGTRTVHRGILLTHLKGSQGLYQQGKWNEAVAFAEQGLELAQSIHSGDHPDIAGGLNNLAGLYRSIG